MGGIQILEQNEEEEAEVGNEEKFVIHKLSFTCLSCVRAYISKSVHIYALSYH